MSEFTHPTVDQRRQHGKALRKDAPRDSHSVWTATATRADPIDLLEEQNASRLEFLVPVRRSRMLASPFSFFRGAARVMAADLAATPVSGLQVQLCGDAHLSNFGLYASPERRLVFDLNDFDETLRGPWEWDVKRLAASFTIAARHNGLTDDESRRAAQRVVTGYRKAMRKLAGMRNADVWYLHVSEEDFLRSAARSGRLRRARKTVARARKRHSQRSLDRLGEEHNGRYRIRSQPPFLVPLRDLVDKYRPKHEQMIRSAWSAYVNDVAADCRVLLSKFRLVDFALKVVGVGSVGTRCWIIMLEGRDHDDPLFLQIKQASDSVLAEYLESPAQPDHGRRVVEGQRLMQTVNDIFLGATFAPETGNHYYWRQLNDWKGSVDVEGLNKPGLRGYAELCGLTLARAHARSGDAIAIAAYLGSGKAFDRAVADFAVAYANQNSLDYAAFSAAIRDGKLEAADAAD